MGLAARPGRGVPAVHHAHDTPADRRIPGWRTGPEPVGSAVPAVHVSAARGAPGSGSCAGILKDCNIPAVAYGFRSTFRELAAEETDQPREVIEAALAHVVGNKVEAAYARPDLFERRRRLMDDWEACLASERPRVPAPTGRTERLHAAQESATRHTAWTVREERRIRRVSGESVPGASRRACRYRARAMLPLRRDDPAPLECDSRRR